MSRKVLFLVSAMNSGGAERVAANLANAWAERGDKVTLVITYSKGRECFYPLAKNVELCYLTDLAGNKEHKDFFQQTKRLLALRRLIRTTQPDVVLSFLTNVNIAALLAAWGLDSPVIAAEHTHPPMIPLSFWGEQVRKWTYPYAKKIVMLTRDGLNWLNSEIPRAHGTVILNPIPYPLAAFEPKLPVESLIAADRKMLLAVGRLNEGKGFNFLLQAFAKLAEDYPEWDLVILGEGPIRQDLMSQIQELNLRSRVHLPGQAGNIGDWYQRADLYVMSSLFEGLPNTLLEAMTYGCPVVSYDCDTGPRDIIRNGENGLLVNPVGDVPALTLALDRLMRDDRARQQMGKEATKVREDYSLKNVIAMWDKLFDEVTEK